MEAIGGILLVCFGIGWVLLSFFYAKVYWTKPTLSPTKR